MCIEMLPKQPGSCSYSKLINLHKSEQCPWKHKQHNVGIYFQNHDCIINLLRLLNLIQIRKFTIGPYHTSYVSCVKFRNKISKHFLVLCMKGSNTERWHCFSNHNCVITSFKFCHIHIVLKKFSIRFITNLVYMLVVCHKDFFPLFLEVGQFFSVLYILEECICKKKMLIQKGVHHQILTHSDWYRAFTDTCVWKVYQCCLFQKLLKKNIRMEITYYG